MRRDLLKTAFIIFIIVAVSAIYLVLNKGHIGNVSLVYTEPVPERVIIVEKEKEYISSVDKEVLNITVSMDGEEVPDGYTLISSNEKVAKINSDNKIQAVSDGKATITVKYDGSQTDFDIRVITPIKTVSFTTTNSVIRVGKELQLKLKTTPSNASIDSLRYESNDEEIATVNANGIVTGVSAGKVTITLIDEYTGIEKKVSLTIRN
jgi:hypothetical protein